MTSVEERMVFGGSSEQPVGNDVNRKNTLENNMDLRESDRKR